MKTLRPYQREAIDALYQYWQSPDAGNGVIVLPTGSGKSLLIAALIKASDLQHLAANRNRRTSL